MPEPSMSPGPRPADPQLRALRLGVAGPVGTGKSSLIALLCRELGTELSLGVITNDIYTDEDARFLRSAGVLAPERIRAVETGACPHTAIRDDVTQNLIAVEDLEADFAPVDLVLVESGGDNLTATFSPALVDAQFFVLDVAGGGDVARKGGPGIAGADLLVVNKTDLAPYVGVDVPQMVHDAEHARAGRPVLALSRQDPVSVARLRGWVLETLARYRAGELDPRDPGPMAPHVHAAGPRGAAQPRRRHPARPLSRQDSPEMPPTRIAVEVRAGRHVHWHTAGLLRVLQLPGPPGGCRLALVATTALLLGGDAVEIEVELGPGASVQLSEVAGTVAYHGRGSPASWHTRIRLADGAVLDWRGEPLVVADGAEVTRGLQLDLAHGARARVRETVVLGRDGERGGRLRSRSTVRRAGRELLVEDLDLDPGLRRATRSARGQPGARQRARPGGRRRGGAGRRALPAGGVRQHADPVPRPVPGRVATGHRPSWTQPPGRPGGSGHDVPVTGYAAERRSIRGRTDRGLQAVAQLVERGGHRPRAGEPETGASRAQRPTSSTSSRYSTRQLSGPVGVTR